MKKLALSMLAIVGLLGVASCSKPAQTVTPQANQQNQKVSFKQMAETSAISSISMLNTPTGNVRRAKLTDPEKQLVLKNLNLVDELLKGDPVKTEVKPVEEGHKYHGQFTEYYTLTVKNLDGSEESYLFYYKETPVVEENKEEKPAVAAENQNAEAPAEKPADKPAEQPAEPVEEEKASKLEGLIVYNEGKEDEKAYDMHGEKAVEKEGEEVEVSFSFKVTDKNNPNSFVKVEQEAETNGPNSKEAENEYMYMRHENGKMVEKVKINFETEADETEYFVSTMKDGMKTVYSFKFEKQADGKELIKVRINENGQKIQAKLEMVDGQYKFLE